MADLSMLGKKWPSAMVARESIREFSGGVLSPKYMANLDSEKKGPPALKVGKKVAYPVGSLIEWMEKRTEAA